MQPRRLEPFVWEVPVGYVDGMRVPGVVYASDELFERALADRAAGSVTFSSTDPPADGTFVKAVTYHRLRVGRDADGWLAEVYLDV